MDNPSLENLEPSRVPIGVDPNRYHKRFLENSSRLFLKPGEPERLEMVRMLIGDGIVIESCQVEDTHELKRQIQINQSSAQHVLYFIRQNNTWGRLRASESSLNSILTAHNVFLPFLDLIQAYGFKVHEDHHNWNGYRNELSKQPGAMDGDLKYEFCYNLQYMEKNNRGKGDPWSLRQLGVYQQIALASCRSTWIILQPTEVVRMQLEQTMERSAKQNRKCEENAVYFHVIFLAMATSNWQEYLDYLRSQLAAFDNKACFWTAGFRDGQNDSVTLSDCQDLKLLQRKILQASSVLDACLDIAKGCADHRSCLTDLGITGLGTHGFSEINVYLKQLMRHRQTIQYILQQSVNSDYLLSKILEFCHNKMLRESNQAIQNTLVMLQHISSESHEENRLLLKLAQQGQRDSQTLKAFTSVATMYFPASLMATIFSSGLVQTQSNVVEIGGRRSFAISSHFWLFVLSSISLTVVTFAFTALLQRLWRHFSKLPMERSML